MPQPSRIKSLKTRLGLMLLGVTIGLFARSIFDSDRDAHSVFTPIPSEFRAEHSRDEYMDPTLGDPDPVWTDSPAD